MYTYVRFFRSQLHGKGQGTVEIAEGMGKVTVRFFQADAVCMFRFTPAEIGDGMDEEEDISEHALRCAISYVHWTTKQKSKCPEFDEEKQLTRIKPWFGDFTTTRDGAGSTNLLSPCFEERRVDHATASTVQDTKSIVAKQGRQAARTLLDIAEVPSAVIRRILSLRGRKRAKKDST